MTKRVFLELQIKTRQQSKRRMVAQQQKKMLNSKSKTMPAYQEDLKDNKKKQKIVYKVHQSDGESNAESDSGPSDDNLDQDQILKLIPKKFGKNKYLRGLDEIKKKKKKVEEDKPKKKKEGPTLMPCMS